MVAGDFIEVFSGAEHAGAYDAVATCFFLDTAHNILQYLEIVYRLLKVRGAGVKGPNAPGYGCS